LNSNPANGASQIKTNHRFVVENSGETTPFDWYHARFNVDINLEKLADGADVAADDHNGIVNSAYSIIKKLNVKMNGVDVYDCSEANQATNIKNLLEYSQGYSFILTKIEMLKKDLPRLITIQVLLLENCY